MRVLVVEDEERLARALKQGLEREGYAVDCLADGSDAEFRLRVSHEEYDLVILDLGLPGMDGVEVCRRLRAASVELPVLMLTARDGTEAKVIGMDSGADDYLVKPFDFDELLARLRMLLRRPRETLPPQLVVGDLIVDPARRCVTCAGRDVALTTKEFTLLEFFVRHPGQVLSRDQILSHVWDAEFDSFSNVVDVHVRNLRRKIDGDRCGSLLETVRGLGYRLRT
jgi:two-component system OmpR family response regulator